MDRNSTMRCVAGVIATLVASICCSLVVANAESKAMQQRNNLASLMLNLVCNGIFLSHRSAASIVRDDFHIFPGAQALWRNSALESDLTDAGMTVRIPATAETPEFRQSSVYILGYGCTLVPPGMSSPRLTPARLPVASSDRNLQWPAGDRDAEAPLESQRRHAVESALDYAFLEPNGWRLATRAVLVVQDGHILAERYSPGIDRVTPLVSWSMAKSITAALLGIYVKDYNLDINAPAPVEAWSGAGDERRAIRTIDLLQMASGLQFPRPENAEAGLLTDADYQSSVYFKPQDTQKLVLSAKLNHRPGTVFEYKNSDPLVVASIMRYGLTQRGQDYATWPRRVLFDKLGARTLVMNVDAFGNFIGSGMVFASARDFARIGMLWLARGNWQEQQLWPDDWYEVLTRPSPANGWYGALVWLNQTDLYPDVPSDAFFFSGAFGQIVMVVPSRRLVVVRLGASERAFEIPVADNGRFSADSFADRFNTLMKMILAVVD